MLVKKSSMPSLPKPPNSLVNMFILTALGGFPHIPEEQKAGLGIIARVVDKARWEYNYAQKLILKEERENNMTYDQIMKRNEGQYMYFSFITDHLESCINSISRAYRLLELNFPDKRSKVTKAVADVRNAIEHAEDRIEAGILGPNAVDISADALIINISGVSLKMQDVASEIIRLEEKVKEILYRGA